MSKPIGETIQTAMQTAVPRSLEYKYLVQFADMSEETLSGVFAELANAINVFSTDENIRFSFRDNSRKVNPRMLEDGYSLYIVIREEALSAYASLSHR